MPEFKDKNGRVYTVAINFNKVRRIRDKYDVLLTDIQGGALDRLATDSVFLLDVLYEISEPQAGEKPDVESFFDSFDGEAVESASAALLTALANFSPPGSRAMLQQLVKQSELVSRASEKMAEKLAEKLSDEAIETAMKEVDSRLDAIVDRVLNQTFSGGKAIGSPD